MWVSAPQEDGRFLNTRVKEPGLSEVTELCVCRARKGTRQPLTLGMSPRPAWKPLNLLTPLGGEGNNLPLCLRSTCNTLPWEVSAGNVPGEEQPRSRAPEGRTALQTWCEQSPPGSIIASWPLVFPVMASPRLSCLQLHLPPDPHGLSAPPPVTKSPFDVVSTKTSQYPQLSRFYPMLSAWSL